MRIILLYLSFLLINEFVFSQCDTVIISKPQSSFEPIYSIGGVFVAENEEDYQMLFHKSSSIDFENKLLITFFAGTRDKPTKSRLEIVCYPDSILLEYSIYEKRGLKLGVCAYSSNTYVIDKLDLSKTYLKVSVISKYKHYKIAKYDNEFLIMNLGEVKEE